MNMKTCPDTIDGAEVVCFVRLDPVRHRYTGSTVLREGGREQRWFHGLAVARYKNDDGVYLFYCDRKWETDNDSLYSSIDDALEEATRQFEVAPSDWVQPNSRE